MHKYQIFFVDDRRVLLQNDKMLLYYQNNCLQNQFCIYLSFFYLHLLMVRLNIAWRFWSLNVRISHSYRAKVITKASFYASLGWLVGQRVYFLFIFALERKSCVLVDRSRVQNLRENKKHLLFSFCDWFLADFLPCR